MPGLACHATAVALGGKALLICGASRAGKSRLAHALIARSSRELPILLVGDDRVLLHPGVGHMIVTPHPRIAGFLERRGLGIVAMPWIAQAPVAGLVDVGLPALTSPWLDGVPRLEIVASGDPEAGAASVLTWWGARTATCATRSLLKRGAAARRCAKD